MNHQHIPGPDETPGAMLAFLTAHGAALRPETRTLLEAVLRTQLDALAREMRAAAVQYRMKAAEIGISDGAYAGTLVDELLAKIVHWQGVFTAPRVPTPADLAAADQAAQSCTGLPGLAPVAPTGDTLRTMLRALIAAEVVTFADADGFEIDEAAAPSDLPMPPFNNVTTAALIHNTLADLVACGEATQVTDRAPNGLFPLRPATATR